MKNFIPISAGVLHGDENKNINLEFVIEYDPTEAEGIIICLSQIDRLSIPGSSISLDENDIYITLPELRRLCRYGLRIYNDAERMIHNRHIEHDSYLAEQLLPHEDDCYE